MADEHDDTYKEFKEAVNMTPSEIENWLETEDSKRVGQKKNGGESVGHQSGRRIIEIKGTKKDDLTDAHYAHMAKVVGYVNRHLAQKPKGDISDTDWCFSLKNWGHDPTKNG